MMLTGQEVALFDRMNASPRKENHYYEASLGKVAGETEGSMMRLHKACRLWVHGG